MTPVYEFSGYVAQFWDLLRGDTTDSPDRTFFLELIRSKGDPVLDVGCGTGRLLLDFLDHGFDVDGIDVSPEMLEICEEKADLRGIAIDVYEQSMEHLDLPRLYRTIVVAASAFQFIVDPLSAAAAMRRFHDHLHPGGVLAMSFSALWQGDDPPTTMPAEWVHRVEVTRTDGAIVRRSTKSAFDVAERLEHTEELYEVIVDGTVTGAESHSHSPARRGYDQEEAVALYDAAGFAATEVLRPWTFEPAAPTDRTFVVVGHKADDSP